MRAKIALLFLAALVLTGCAREEKPYTLELYAMNTVMTFRLYGGNEKEAGEEISRTLSRLEGVLSMHDEQSELSALNAGKESPEAISDELFESIEIGKSLSQETNGAFDITLGRLTELWAIGTDKPRVPSREEISRALLQSGREKLQIEGRKIRLQQGAKLDLGGIGKGYATDKIVEILEKNNIPAAVVSLGGNVYVKGTKKGSKPFTVGITDPDRPGSALGHLPLSDFSAVTSGAYERFFERDGILYHHILDPKTGYPAESDLKSVTIIAKSSARADAFSTALFVMGRKAAQDFLKEHPELSAILVTKEDEIFLTDDLKEKFTLTNHQYEIK